MKKIQLLCELDVMPINAPPSADGSVDEHAKQLVFEDQDTGEVLIYPMSGAKAKDIAGKLKMNNRALQAQIQKKIADEMARAVITGGPGPDGHGGIVGPGGAPLT